MKQSYFYAKFNRIKWKINIMDNGNQFQGQIILFAALHPIIVNYSRKLDFLVWELAIWPRILLHRFDSCNNQIFYWASVPEHKLYTKLTRAERSATIYVILWIVSLWHHHSKFPRFRNGQTFHRFQGGWDWWHAGSSLLDGQIFICVWFE